MDEVRTYHVNKTQRLARASSKGVETVVLAFALSQSPSLSVAAKYNFSEMVRIAESRVELPVRCYNRIPEITCA